MLDWAGDLADPLPADLLAELKKLPDRTWSYRHVHQPTSGRDAREAQRRLRFDEFLRIQLPLVLRKRAIEAERGGIEHAVDGELIARFLGALPYDLTGGPGARARRDPRRPRESGPDAPPAPG